MLYYFIIFSITTFSQALISVTGKRIYEHHSSSINGNNFYGIYANGFQSGYDFLNNVYKNTTTSSDHANMDLVETNGIFGNGSNYKNVGFTSGVSVIWNGAIYGNGATKYYLTPTAFDFTKATLTSELASAYIDASASTTVNVPQKGRTYIAKLNLANAVRYVAIKITNILGLTDQQVQDMVNKKSIYADVYFDFDYKYGTLMGPVSAFSADNNNICTGQQITYNDQTSNAPTAWNWSFPGGTPSSSTLQNPKITYSTPGTYNVVLTTSNTIGTNSVTKTNFITINQFPSKPVISAMANTLSSSSANSHQWHLNGIIIPGATSKTHVASVNGNYTVVAIGAGGCSEMSEIYAFTTTSIQNNYSTDLNLSVFPNPNDGRFTMTFDAKTKADYSVLIKNVLGQVVYSSFIENIEGIYSIRIDLSNFEKGIYTISISDSIYESTKKFIVK